MSRADNQLKALFDKANKIAIKEVERLARKIMKKNPSITGFCMAMGSASFSQQEGVINEGTDDEQWQDRYVSDDDPRIKEMEDFIAEWNVYLHITGYPMKIDGSWDAPIKNDW